MENNTQTNTTEVKQEEKTNTDNLKEAMGWVGRVSILIILFIAFGWIMGSTYELHHGKTIAKQHEELVVENNFNYCPYCGEKLEKN